MSNNNQLSLPTTIDDVDATNIRRVPLSRDGITALFSQSSYDIGEISSTTNSARSVREYRPSTTSNNPTNSFRPTVAAQRSSLFRFVIQRSASFAPNTVSQAMPNTRRHTQKQIHSICNQHDRVSSIDLDVEPVASITNSLQAPSIAAIQICRSLSMPNTSIKYHKQHLLIEGGGKPI